MIYIPNVFSLLNLKACKDRTRVMQLLDTQLWCQPVTLSLAEETLAFLSKCFQSYMGSCRGLLAFGTFLHS